MPSKFEAVRIFFARILFPIKRIPSPYIEHSAVYFRPTIVKDVTMQSSKCVIIDNIIIIKNVFITFQTAKGLKSLKSTPSLLFIDGSSQIFYHYRANEHITKFLANTLLLH